MRSLVEPPAPLLEHERRSARLLGWLTFALLLATFAAFIVTWVVLRSRPGELRRYLIVIAVGMVSYAVALALNHRGRLRGAARAAVAGAFVAAWLSVVLVPTYLTGDLTPVYFTVLSVVLSSLLLSELATVLLAVFIFAASFYLMATAPAHQPVNWPSFLVFTFFVSAISLAANVVHRRNAEQIEEQRRELLERERELLALSVRDSLTGLFNRRYLEETLERELARAEREGRPLAVVTIDVDDLKGTNDRWGHAAGDELLRRAGELLSGNVRMGDAACRYGGDEFVLVLPNTDRHGALLLAEKIRKAAEATRPEDTSQSPASLGFSLGVAVFPDAGPTAPELLAAADAALYRAKREGGGRWRAAGRS